MIDSRTTPQDGVHVSSARRWRYEGFPPMLKATIAWHALALAGFLSAPRAWPWWLAFIMINHATVTIAGLWPRSSLLGPNWTRLPAHAGNANAIALTIDDGPDPEVTPQVLSLLGVYRARASFFCVGERVARHPELAREIVRLGHTIENHSQHHRHSFSLMGPRGIEREIVEAQHSIAGLIGTDSIAATGKKCRQHFGRLPEVDSGLHECIA